MQEGLLFIWLVSFAVTLGSWIYLEMVRTREAAFESRRKITGCELARQILDRNHLNRISVTWDSEPGSAHRGPRFNQLVLPEKIYYGTRLADLAGSLQGASHLVEESGSFVPASIRIRRAAPFRMGVCAAWFLVLMGMLLPGWKWIFHSGETLFVLAFLVVLVSWADEGEVTQRAFSSLALLEGLGPDELVRMKRLLQAMRWTPFAELIQIPLSLLFRNKKKIPTGVSSF